MTTAAYRDSVLPAGIGAAADRERLGRHRATYRPVTPNPRRLIIEAAVTAVGVVAAVAGFVGGAVIVGILGATVAVMCGLRVLADLGWLGFVGVRNKGSRLDLYDNGLVASYRGQVRVVRYDSTTVRRKIVRLVDNPAPEQISYTYTIVDTTGTPIVLRGGIERPHEWGPAIERGIVDTQLPRARTVIEADGRVDFESFWLTATEIGAGRESVPWSEVAEIAVVGGWLSVRVAGRSQPLESLPVSLVPNYAVFRALTEWLRVASEIRQ
ncbi:DUF6585 family protein [Nocardia transvalensis]|uniref:DUF6585 family protein n=1 Tax=Nocardia transvalensis TaxID=37333 RepID=UPI001893F24F|nr:DUF6585 family protein [Nocardia transvalensis]MBF6327549.1 hypothetical protein [Nocardia transvalensis]